MECNIEVCLTMTIETRLIRCATHNVAFPFGLWKKHGPLNKEELPKDCTEAKERMEVIYRELSKDLDNNL